MKKYIILSITLFSIFCILESNFVQAATYYVGKSNCSDSGPGTLSQPWCTIQKAANTLRAGDTVYVKGGIYNEGSIAFANSGTLSNFITIANAPGERPIITKPGTPRAFYVRDRSYIHIKGLTLHDYDNDGISIFYSDYIICTDIHAYGNGNAGIESVDSNYIIVQDSNLHHNGWKSTGDSGWGDGLSINNHAGSGYSSIVRGNLMYANWQKREGSYWDGNGHTWDMAGPGGVHIMANNVFFNNGGCGALNGQTGNMAIVNNVFFRNMADYDNNRNQGELYLTNDWVGNTLLKNNIFYARPRTAQRSPIYPILRYGDSNQNEVVENNLVWSELGSNTIMYWLSSMSLDSWIRNISPSTLTGDPGFISAPFDNETTTFHGTSWIDMDISSYDFGLKQGSQSIDAGTFLTQTTSSGSGTIIPVKIARYFTDGFGVEGQGDLIQVGSNDPVRITAIDYNNNRITVNKSISWNINDSVSLPYSGAAPDIGAYEYTGVTPSPPTKTGDLNSDGKVDVIDLGILLSNWNSTSRPAADINQDGRVDVVDLGILLSNWG